MDDKILDRIRKLLRLAANAGSEHEAAIAADRARLMMAEHEIHEAQISLEVQAPRVPEQIDQEHAVTDTTKRVAWHMVLISAVARDFGCRPYWSSGKVCLFGRLSAVQSASYTSQYLMREVERLCDRAAVGEDGKSAPRKWRNAFRIGCAETIAKRLREARREREIPTAEEVLEEFGVPSPSEPRPEDAVLAIVKKDQEQVEEEWERYSAGWRGRGGLIGCVSWGASGGYASGLAAGSAARIGGRSRGGLPAGQGSLKS